MTYIWTGRFDKKAGDPKYCRASVHGKEGRGWAHNHQCQRKPVCVRTVNGREYGFCRQHDPEAVAERREARYEQWRLEREARDREYEKQKQTAAALEACKAAIKEIAAGHNNPRALAAATLELFP